MKITVEAPDWVTEEEKRWAFEVARLIYRFSDKKYLDASTSRIAVSDSIEVVKVTWGKDHIDQYITFIIVFHSYPLDEFKVFVRCYRTPINDRQPIEVRIYVQGITDESLARMFVGRKGDVVTRPEDTARGCVEGIQIAVHYQSHKFLQQGEILKQIDAALRENLQEDQT